MGQRSGADHNRGFISQLYFYISEQYFSTRTGSKVILAQLKFTVIINCIFELYSSTVFLNCISEQLSGVFEHNRGCRGKKATSDPVIIPVRPAALLIVSKCKYKYTYRYKYICKCRCIYRNICRINTDTNIYKEIQI